MAKRVEKRKEGAEVLYKFYLHIKTLEKGRYIDGDWVLERKRERETGGLFSKKEEALTL